LTFAAPVIADPQAPAVWYRASEACPNGTQFIDKLAENARQARLAQAGDHIDFVVTLVTDRNETVGRLERQTDSGVVAIRELRDETCAQVADALALSLGLALTPEQSNAAPVALVSPTQTPSEGSGTTPNVATSETAARPAPASPETAASATTAATQPNSAPARLEPSPEWSVGADFAAMIGITTHPLPRAEVFLDFKPALRGFLPNLSLRGSVVGSMGSSETAVGPVQRWILAGRAEACPVAWAEGRFDLRPCAGFELGVDSASTDGDGALNDHGVWAAPAAQLRLAFALQPRVVWLEAAGGALIPLIRKEIFSGSQSLYRDAPAIFHAGLGISIRLP